MTRRSDVSGPPRSYVRDGGAGWADVEAGDVPVFVVYAQRVVRRLRPAMGGRSVREVAQAAGLHHRTLSRLLAGESWPDLVTLSKLEQALGVRLWPER